MVHDVAVPNGELTADACCSWTTAQQHASRNAAARELPSIAPTDAAGAFSEISTPFPPACSQKGDAELLQVDAAATLVLGVARNWPQLINKY